jgi:hypothetical protein
MAFDGACHLEVLIRVAPSQVEMGIDWIKIERPGCRRPPGRSILSSFLGGVVFSL